MARLTIQEARHLIVATDGAILLLDDETGALTTVAGFGDELPTLRGFQRGLGILGSIAPSMGMARPGLTALWPSPLMGEGGEAG